MQKYKAILFIVSILFNNFSFAASGVDSNPTIAIVKKLKYANEEQTVHYLMQVQDLCLQTKIGLYQQRGITYSPNPKEKLSAEDIIKLLDVKIEEYFKNNKYAIIESGKNISFDHLINHNKKDLDSFVCEFYAPAYFSIEIIQPDKRIISSWYEDINAKNHEGLNQINSIPALLQKYKSKKVAIPFSKIVNVKNTNYKCGWDSIAQSCYLTDFPIHPGTDRYVVVETGVPTLSLFKKPVNSDNNAAFNPFDMLYALDKLNTIQENISIIIGKNIPDDKFEIPKEAKNFKTIRY